ncbi:MAG: cytochrome c oxidase assembly protein, partial [Pseudomonas sp.]|nr:cytochrome c oxidase assembly protein [Pseudomonas sp.]
MNERTSLRRLVTRLMLLTVVMFAFGFALVPIYDVMC